VELLRTADRAARRFNPDARIRLVPDGHGVRFELADGQVAGDAVVEHEAGFTLLVAAGISGTVDVAEPHDRLVLIRENGDT
jgi:hypothetical protein